MQEANDYPHPNPHFPVPLRPMAKLGCFGVLIAGLLTLVAFASLAFAAGSNQRAGVVIAVLCFIVGLIGTPLLLIRRIKARRWRSGLILPARITRAPEKNRPNPILLVLSVVPYIGYVFGFVAHALHGERGHAQGLICVGGLVYELSWEAGRFRSKLLEISDVWILVDNRGQAWALEDFAPRRYWFRPVPADAVEYLDSSLPESFSAKVHAHREAVLERECREAAKANTRAMRRADRYSKSRT